LEEEATVNITLGIVLLIIGVAMVLLARPNQYGNRRLSMSRNILTIYPAICLIFLAFGLMAIFG
jgi:hypothetical protein